MKKILLSAVALVAAMNVNAQAVSFNADNADYAALNLSTESGTTLTAGTVIGKIDGAISFEIGAEDSYKAQSRGPFTIGSATVNAGGLQGNSNPKDADNTAPSSSLKVPTSGAFFKVTCSKDGYLYVFQQASSNKAYTVFENDFAIGYTYAAIGDASTDLGAVYGFELKGAGEYNYLKDADITSVEWPEQIYTRQKGTYDSHLDADGKWVNIAKSGLGVIKFPVFADCTYIVNANGSKMTAAGFYFDTTGDATVTVKSGDEEVNLLTGGTAGISSTKIVLNQNGAIYNIAGQRVANDYKGLVIKNGRKMIQK